MTRKRLTVVALLFSITLLILPAIPHAGSIILNDNGFLYTIGEFPISLEGDELGGVGFVSSTIPSLNVDFSLNELTWSISGLVVTDQFSSTTSIYTNYSGGTIKMYLDPAMNADYGTAPPGESSTATFEDGDLFLMGTVTTAIMTYNTVTQTGVLVALVNFTYGSALPELDEPNGNIVEYTFGPGDPNIPPGYDLQAIGRIVAPALCTVQGNVSYIFDPMCTTCRCITQLVLEYTGSGDLSTASINNAVEYSVVGDQLIILPPSGDEALPGNIKITVGADEVDIHTSCSRPIDQGNVIGDFTVVQVDKVYVPCADAECVGLTSLELLYHGIGDPATVTVSDGAYAVVSGNTITILPTGDELKGNTTIGIGCDVVTIHTACSQPIEVGFTYDDYEVTAVEKVYPETPGGTMPPSGPVVGVTVDLVDGEGTIYSTLTNEFGNYIFNDVAIVDFMVSCVVPLGYSPLTPMEVERTAAPGDVVVVDFQLERLATQDKPRSCGFWKHQVNCALKGKQKGVQVPVDMLLTYFDQIHTRFDKYFDVFIPVVTLEDLFTVLSPKKPTMHQKAERQFGGLLMNVVSERLATWQFVSEDEATASQAITYISNLLSDGVDSNDELAKDIAEMINLEETIAAGVIPLHIEQIAYLKRAVDPFDNLVPSAIANAGNYPNPFNPTTTITYELSRELPVTVTIYNVLGQKVRDLVSGRSQNGLNTVSWDGRDGAGRMLTSGTLDAVTRT